MLNTHEVQILDEISEAGNQQAEFMNQVTVGVDQISTVVQTNSATAEETAAAREEISSQANLLKELITRFKMITESIGKFMKQLLETESDIKSDSVFFMGFRLLSTFQLIFIVFICLIYF